eukprot:12121315-Ditylum_brightwellii.AAC.1
MLHNRRRTKLMLHYRHMTKDLSMPTIEQCFALRSTTFALPMIASSSPTSRILPVKTPPPPGYELNYAVAISTIPVTVAMELDGAHNEFVEGISNPLGVKTLSVSLTT